MRLRADSDHGERMFAPLGRRRGNADLPVFRMNRADVAVFYAPGLVSVVQAQQAEPLEAALCGAPSDGDDESGVGALRDVLSRQAKTAIAIRHELLNKPFEPECLTLYLHGRCNLSCSYCLRKPADSGSPGLDAGAVRQAAVSVAESCALKGKPLTAVFHGWGEPVLDQGNLDGLVRVVREAAEAGGIESRLIISSNGVMPAETSDYLGRTFGLVNLSCDGPPEIQDVQRPLAGGGAGSAILERTAEVIKRSPARLAVRSTITPATLGRQEEMIDYITRVLRADEVRFEPAYRMGAGGFSTGDALPYVESFFAARAAARSHGIPLTYSGARPAEIHGPYCNVFREVLNLLPDGSATACFADAAGGTGAGLDIAYGKNGGLTIPAERIAKLRNRLWQRSERCLVCFNCYHCVGECPERCPLDRSDDAEAGESFRCRLARLTAERLILEGAETLCSEAGIDGLPAWRRMDSPVV
jgi:MoaA/NifB/PqqE/SkfB family radical SAM enzyme